MKIPTPAGAPIRLLRRPHKATLALTLATFIGASLPVSTAQAHNYEVHYAHTWLAWKYLNQVAAGRLPEPEAFTAREAAMTLEWLDELPIASHTSDPEQGWSLLGLDGPTGHDVHAPAGSFDSVQRSAPALAHEDHETLPDFVVAFGNAHTDDLHDVWVVVPGLWSYIYEQAKPQVYDEIFDTFLGYSDDNWPSASEIADSAFGLCEDLTSWDPTGITFMACGLVAAVVSLAGFAVNLAFGAVAAIVQGIASTILPTDMAEWGAENEVVGCDADDPVWAGIPNDDCEEMEEWLEDIQTLKLSVYPGSKTSLFRMLRGQLRMVRDACTEMGVDLDSDACGDVLQRALRTPHYSLYAKEEIDFTGSGSGARKGPHTTSWTNQSHFMDLLSPAGTQDVPDFADATEVAQQFAAGLTLGVRNDVDGYSLGDGRLFEADALSAVPRAWSEHDMVGDVFSYRHGDSDRDETISRESQDFGATLSWRESGHMLTRRRVGCGLMETSDGHPGTKCDATDGSEDFTSTAIVNTIHTPADNAALDGWSMFLDTRIPLVHDRSGRLPFMDLGPLWADDCPLSSGRDCQARLADGNPEVELNNGKFPSARLYGLGITSHMLSDMTVPHHIAPTSGFGHAHFEGWMEGFLLGNRAVYVATIDMDQQSGELTINPYHYQIGGFPSQGGTTPLHHVAPNEGDWQAFMSDVRLEQPLYANMPEALDRLEKVMDALAEGQDCQSFAMRRLATATALVTAEHVQNTSVNPDNILEFTRADDIASATLWRDGALFEEHGDLARQALASHTGDLGLPFEHMKSNQIGSWTYRNLAHKLIPHAVATQTLMLVNAWRVAHADENNLPRPTCDEGYGESLTERADALTVQDNGTCVEDKTRGLIADGMSRHDATIQARCACSGTPDQDTCIEAGEEDWFITTMQATNKLDPLTLAHLRERNGRRAHGQSDSDDVSFLKQRDADGDGIPDAADDCPNEPGDRADHRGAGLDPDLILDVAGQRGCRADTDGDGVSDARDRCPNSSGPVDMFGCSSTDRFDALAR